MFFNKKYLKNKCGFSLFEVVVTMSIVAIFIAAASNIFTQKFKRKLSLPAHGRFECYYTDEGILHQKQVLENSVVSDEDVEADADGNYYCSFTPVKSAAYLVVNAVGGGGAGGVTTGGSAGTYKSIFLPTTTHKLRIVPGKGSIYGSAELSDNEKNTFVYDLDSAAPGTDGRIVINIAGGTSDSGNSAKSLVKYCNVSMAKYVCIRDAYCSFDNKGRVLNVGYCEDDGEDVELTKEKFTFDDIINQAKADGVLLDNHQVVTHNKYTEIYKDIDHPLAKEDIVYSLAILFEGNFTADKEESGFKDYLNALKVDNGIAALSCPAGDGGAAAANGCDGAVILAW